MKEIQTKLSRILPRNDDEFRLIVDKVRVIHLIADELLGLKLSTKLESTTCRISINVLDQAQKINFTVYVSETREKPDLLNCDNAHISPKLIKISPDFKQQMFKSEYIYLSIISP